MLLLIHYERHLFIDYAEKQWNQRINAMAEERKTWIRKIGIDLITAICFVSIASVLRFAFLSELGRATPYLTYYPAVMIAAVIGGLSAGLLTTIQYRNLWHLLEQVDTRQPGSP